MSAELKQMHEMTDEELREEVKRLESNGYVMAAQLFRAELKSRENSR